MAVEAGNTSSSGDADSPDTSYNWPHTCHANSNLLIVLTRARDAVGLDALISGITYDGNPLVKARRQ